MHAEYEMIKSIPLLKLPHISALYSVSNLWISRNAKS